MREIRGALDRLGVARGDPRRRRRQHGRHGRPRGWPGQRGAATSASCTTPSNGGLGAVYRTGFAQARGDLLTFFPADGQFPAVHPGDVRARHADGHDIVLGYVPQRRDSLAGAPALRRRAAPLSPAVRPAAALPGRVHGPTRRSSRGMPLRSEGRGWAIVMELLVRAARAGWRMESLPTPRSAPRRSGVSKVQNVAYDLVEPAPGDRAPGSPAVALAQVAPQDLDGADRGRMAAVSARRMRGPRPTGWKPGVGERARPRAAPSPRPGPPAPATAGGRGERAQRRAGPRRSRKRSSQARRRARPGARPGSTVGATQGHHRAAALLGGAARHLLPALLARALAARAGPRRRCATVTTGRISATPSSVAFWIDELHAVALQRRTGRGRRAAATRAAARPAPADAGARRPGASPRRARPRTPRPAPSKTRTAAPGAQAQHLARVVRGVLGQARCARPGAASGTWKRGTLTRPRRTTSAAHSPSRAHVEPAATPRRRRGPPATSSASRPESTSGRRGRAGRRELVARARAAAAR